MKNIRIGVITGDREYGLALCRSLSRNGRGFITELCKEKIEPGIDVTIIDDNLHMVNLNGSKTAAGKKPAVTALITENTETAKATENNLNLKAGKDGGTDVVFYKYGNVRRMAESLEALYYARTGSYATPVRLKGCKVISVTGDRGGSGKTTFSLALAQELVRYRGRRTLYISFEPFPSASKGVCCSPEKMMGLSRFFYCFLQGTRLPMESFVIRDEYGVDMLPPSAGKNPLLDLEWKQLSELLDYFASAGGYDVLICDMTGSFTDREMQLLEGSDLICLMNESEQVRDYLTFKLGEEMSERIVWPNICRDESSASCTDGIFRISIDRDLGKDVKLFAERYI